MGCNSSKAKLDITSAPAARDTSENEFVEGVVCKVQDINENEMKTFELDEEKVLVVKQNGVISALGSKCTHYGAPLVNGALGDGRIRCQWHGACFKLATGDIEDFPGKTITLPRKGATCGTNAAAFRLGLFALLQGDDRKRQRESEGAQIGTIQQQTREAHGKAGGACQRENRGYRGRALWGHRRRNPATRRLHGPDSAGVQGKLPALRPSESEQADGLRDRQGPVPNRPGVAATAVDTAANTVSLSNGAELQYDKLYVATGCKPRKPNVPGADLKNVRVLKDYDDSAYAFPLLNPDVEIVVIGSSFIGMEAANFCVDKVKSVTVVGRGAVPFRSTWGERIGAAILALFESKGVKYIANNGIKKINGSGAVSSVELNDGQILKCDILFCGIGSSYFTDFLKGSGVELQPDGSIETNEFMQTNVPNVYAGGDIAYAPVWSYHNRKVAIGHYGLAQYHGRAAAVNMLGKNEPIKAVPYFWTMLFGKGFRYAGHGSYDDIIYAGDVEGLKFMAFFLKEHEVVSVTSCGMDPLVSKFAERLAEDRKLYRSDLQEDPLAWSKAA
ncbi:hypothetical protein YQE_08354, partial [Dendroctonus ponderosae]